jgi:thiol-disulfide isomerase/thioredoxin
MNNALNATPPGPPGLRDLTNRRAHRLLVFATAALAAAVVAACSGRGPIDTAQVVMLPIAVDSLATLVHDSGGKATLVSVWASWCEPCRQEFPGVVRLARAYKDRGLRVIFVSADLTADLPAARRFLADEGVDWATYYTRGEQTALVNALDPRWTGGIPGSFLYDKDGRLRDFWEGAMNYEGFEQRVLPVISSRPAAGS